MKDRPLEFGELLHSRINYDERGDSRLFNSERFIEVYKAKVNKRLEDSMNGCRDCPHCKMVIRQEENHALLEKFIEGRAYCEATREYKSPCPVKMPGSGYISTPTGSDMIGWIKEAEVDAEKAKRSFITPRKPGKSRAGKIFQEMSKSAPDFKEKIWDDSEEDLNEAVEFETNRSNYDNFGSW